MRDLDDIAGDIAAAALAYRDSSAVIMHKHRDQAEAVLEALAHAGYTIVRISELP